MDKNVTDGTSQTRERPGLVRQMLAFGSVGIIAAIVHYGLLIGLVEGWRVAPVPATLVGYVAGGIVSYMLNRKLTYDSDRPHMQATWRFALVAGAGFLLTWALMHVFTRWLGLPYLRMQFVTTGIVLVWSFVANRLWTFGEPSAPLSEPDRK